LSICVAIRWAAQTAHGANSPSWLHLLPNTYRLFIASGWVVLLPISIEKNDAMYSHCVPLRYATLIDLRECVHQAGIYGFTRFDIIDKRNVYAAGENRFKFFIGAAKMSKAEFLAASITWIFFISETLDSPIGNRREGPLRAGPGHGFLPGIGHADAGNQSIADTGTPQ